MERLVDTALVVCGMTAFSAHRCRLVVQSSWGTEEHSLCCPSLRPYKGDQMESSLGCKQI